MDSTDVKTNQRNRSGRQDGSVDDEVQKLFRKNNGKISSADFVKLRQKYDDNELVEKIQKAYVDKHVLISKKAKKFAQLIREKYSNEQYPFHILLEKARLFKTKHELSDDEFAEFQRIYEQELVGLKSGDVLIPANNMMKVLGSVSVDFQGFTLKLDDNDYKNLQEILKLNASTKALHAQVLLQSMQYQDCDFEAVTGTYNRELGHRSTESVHPVVAAMFLPKIDILERHFLQSNISNIVKARYNSEALTNRPDYELFYALTNDPNDVVCDGKSAVTDLLNRAQVQNQLWNSVLSLRNGQYYNTSFRDFINTVDMCRLNKHDNPDLIYGRYDGTVLKRLLSTFSFRPTVVSTTAVYNLVNINPYQQNVRPVVSAISMINLRLPPTLNNDEPISLSDALEQHQYFFENGVMLPRHTSLIYSRDVLFFYVDRRANVIKYSDMQPFNISNLPTAISGFEKLNDRDIIYENEIRIRGDVYNLRSVVLSEVNRNLQMDQNIVVGSSALIMTHVDLSKGRLLNEYLHYDPIRVSDSVERAGVRQNRSPIGQIRGTPDITAPNASFLEMATKRGIIFMYQNVVDTSKGSFAF
jgi:hypothetical protein